MPRNHLRSIQKAYDEISQAKYDADELLKGYKEAYKLRAVFARDDIKPVCTECYQPLMVSHRGKHLFLSHKPNSGPCPLKTGDWTKSEEESYNKAIAKREGPRHIELKNAIGQKLSKVHGVDVSTISIDDRFIKKDDGRRRPDVYCQYKGRELVFEIQISHLSLRYILDRHDFYKKHGIYLIWVLDGIDLESQESFELDIKYLSSSQNFFILNERKKNLNFLCKYKRVFIESLTVKSKWYHDYIDFEQLKFNPESLEAYYYDFGVETKMAEDKLPELRRLKEENEKREAARKRREAVKSFRKELIEVWQHGSHPIYPLDHFSYYRFERDQKEYLNILLKLDSDNKRYKSEPILVHCVLNRENSDFFDILLFSEYIALDVNDVGPSGISVFQAISEKKNLFSQEGYKWTLFNRGYKLKDSDINWLKKRVNKSFTEKDYERKLVLYRAYEGLEGHGDDLMSTAFENQELLCVLYSAKIGREFGWRSDFKQLVNTIIMAYPTSWPIVRLAYENFHGIWDGVLENDKTGMVKNKLQQFESRKWVLNYYVLEMVEILYPELIDGIQDLRMNFRVTDGHWTSEID